MDLHVPYLYYIRGDKCRRVVGAGRSNKYGIWFIWTHRNSPRVLSEAFDRPRQSAEDLSPLPSAISFVILGQISRDLSSNLGRTHPNLMRSQAQSVRSSAKTCEISGQSSWALRRTWPSLAVSFVLLTWIRMAHQGLGTTAIYLQFHKCSQIQPAWRHYILMFQHPVWRGLGDKKVDLFSGWTSPMASSSYEIGGDRYRRAGGEGKKQHVLELANWVHREVPWETSPAFNMFRLCVSHTTTTKKKVP